MEYDTQRLRVRSGSDQSTFDAELREIGQVAELLTDLESLRVAVQNRLRQGTRTAVDKDGVFRGQELSADTVDLMAGIVTALAGLEAGVEKNLRAKMRRNRLWKTWGRTAVGVGEKQLARLLAAIGGDPSWHGRDGRVRTLGELFSYCGYAVVGGAAPAKRRGMVVNWNPDARMRAFLVAESCMKRPAGTDGYRKVYDVTRERYADAVHPGECVRCGPSGHPALPGSALSDGHKHARAVRAVAKAVLADLYEAAMALR